jgi:hypothetical protein
LGYIPGSALARTRAYLATDRLKKLLSNLADVISRVLKVVVAGQ